MSEWKRVEQPADPAPQSEPDLASIPDPIPVAEELPFDPTAELPPLVDTTLPDAPVDTVVEKPEKIDAPVIPSKPLKKRRRNRTAAPLGFLILLLALVGAITVVISSVGWIGDALDDTELKADLEEFLEPVTLQNPTAFKEGAAGENVSCIKAAIWRVTELERIRMRQEKAKCRFKTDDTGRTLLPEKEVNDAFVALFGKGTPSTTLFAEQKDGFSIWYNADTKQYHVPAFPAALYQTVIDEIDEEDNRLTVKVGYVAAEDIQLDNRGNDIPPTEEDASLFQYYTVEETDSGYRLLSITDAVAAR